MNPIRLRDAKRVKLNMSHKRSGAAMEPLMTEANYALVLDLVEWIAIQPRTYTEIMEAWRTSCPRLTIWEDATDQGLVVREYREGVGVGKRGFFG